MKPIYMAAFVAIFVAAIAMPDAASVRKELETKYTKFSVCVLKRNVDDIKKMSTSNFVYKYKNGTQLGLKESLDMLKMNLLMMKSIDSASFKIAKLTVSGNNATAITDIKVAATMAGNGGKTQKVLNTSQTRDFWINTPKGWLIKRSEEIKSLMTVNGKPVG